MSKRKKRRKDRTLHIERQTAPGSSPGIVAPHPAHLPSEASVLAYGPQQPTVAAFVSSMHTGRINTAPSAMLRARSSA